MPRPKRVVSDSFPYHVSARCINKEWFDVPIEQVWDIFSTSLYFAHHAYGARIHSFVLMNNHFHLIVSTPYGNISEIMWFIMLEASRQITTESGRINQTFGGPFFSSVITSDIYLMHAYKYVYRNPVEAGLSSSVESYPYSTLRGLLGFSKSIIPLVSDEILFSNVEETLKWLNTSYKEGVREELKLALTKKEFKLRKLRYSRRPSILETQLS